GQLPPPKQPVEAQRERCERCHPALRRDPLERDEGLRAADQVRKQLDDERPRAARRIAVGVLGARGLEQKSEGTTHMRRPSKRLREPAAEDQRDRWTGMRVAWEPGTTGVPGLGEAG